MSDILSIGCVWFWWDKDDGCLIEVVCCCVIVLCFVLGIGVVGCRLYMRRLCSGGWYCLGCSWYYLGKLYLF